MQQSTNCRCKDSTHCCRCETACPCVVLGPSAQGSCTVVIGWHIDKGSDDEVDLSGLDIAFAVYAPGKMHEVPWEVAVYLDDRATAEQAQSLVKIVGGQAGGHLRTSRRTSRRFSASEDRPGEGPMWREEREG